jgi:signal transduction histidine kinase
MSEGAGERRRPPARSLPEALVRTLRHEIGDFLQKVYATTALLKMRLPADWELEQGLVARLRERAESCKDVLDAVHDFICSVQLNCEGVDLAALARELSESVRSRHPHLEIHCEAEGIALAQADPRRARQVAEVLLTNACESAQARVVVSVQDRGTEVVLTVSDDGPGVPEELNDLLLAPFATTKAGHAGVGLALARKLMELHGGRLTAASKPGGGFLASAAFPAEPTNN